jgi:hypothetical protein
VRATGACAASGLTPISRLGGGVRNHMEEMRSMKKLIVASVLSFGLAAPALAAEKYFVTVDTVGNGSVVQSIPGTGHSASKKAIGNTDGYESMEAAQKYLDEIREDDPRCEGVIAG